MTSEPAPEVSSMAKHPLQQLREILGWSREECAKETGLKTSTIQNIERGAAPLPQEAAFAIEAATSCNAMELGSSAEAWRRMRKDKPLVLAFAGHNEEARQILGPKALDGSPFTREIYEHYKKAALETPAVEKAITDLGRRVRLLLGPLEKKPEKFRRLYRYLVQVMNKAKEEDGPSEAAMAEYAARSGEATLEESTVQELAAKPEIAEHPVWKNAKVLERFAPDQKVHVVREKYMFWPFTEVVGGKDHYVTPDYTLGSRIVQRITLPDAKMLVLMQSQVESGGLQARLTDGQVQQESRPADAVGARPASDPA